MKAIITIPGNTISKKNSKQIVVTGNGKRRVISSDNYLQWEKAALWSLKGCEHRGTPWYYPVYISFHFVRQNRRTFDYNNMSQGVCDVLQQAGIIANDDMNHVIPHGYSWSVDPANPRVIVTIEEG